MRAGGLVFSLLAACGPAPGPVESPTSTPVREPAHELGDARTIVQGRIALGRRGHAPESWLDIEVGGPGRDALAVCAILVEREHERLSHLDSNIGVVIERACSDDALAPPALSTPFALLQSERLDSVALTLELGPSATGKKLDTLAVRRTFLSGFSNQAACQAALERIRTGSDQDRAKARDQAKAWLGDELSKQRQAADGACGADPKSAECERARGIVSVLEKKLAESDAPVEPEPDSHSATCFRR